MEGPALVWWGLGTGVSSFLLMTLFYLILVNLWKRKKSPEALDREGPEKREELKVIPSPPSFPFIGHLHLLNG
jgi:hypothetical protein